MQGQSPGYVITSLVTAPASSGLTTIANVKDDLDITDGSNDARLTRFITEESAAIARHCNRVFGLATWRDEFRPRHGIWGEGVRAALNPLTLTRWPVSAKIVTFTGNTYSSNIIDTLSSTQGLAVGQLISGAGIPAGTTIESVGASSIQISTNATATAAGVPLSTGISVVETVAGVDTGLAAGTDFELDQGSLLPGDEGASRLYRLNLQGNPRTWPAAKITVVYQAGYALPGDSSPNLPSDLESACIRIVVGRFQAKNRDPMVRSKEQPGVGRTEYWVGAAPGQSGPYPNEIMATLDKYRVPVIA